MRLRALLFIIFTTRLWGQAPDNTVLLSVNEGLSQGMVFDVLQGRDGFMWLATKDGLNRYDGYRFGIFTHDPFDPFSIASNEIWQIYEDSLGRLWLSYPGGIDVFMPGSGRFFHIDKDLLPDFDGSEVTFTETPDGVLWVTDLGNLLRIEVPPGAFESALTAGDGILHPFVSELGNSTLYRGTRLCFLSVRYNKRNNALLVGTFQGFFRLDTDHLRLELIALEGIPVRIFEESNSGEVWLKSMSKTLFHLYSTFFDFEKMKKAGFEDGIWVWNGDPGACRKIPFTREFSKLSKFDANGFLWILYSAALEKWRPETLAAGGEPEFRWTSRESFAQAPGFYFSAFNFDRSGIAWLGTSGFGAVKINPSKPKFVSHYPNNSQRGLVEDAEGNLLPAAFPAYMYPAGRAGQIESNAWLGELGILAINAQMVFDRDGNCWGNNQFGKLFRVDARTRTARTFDWEGAGLLAGKNGKLISVTEKGLAEFDPKTEEGRLLPFGHPETYPHFFIYHHSLYEDAQGAVWIFAFKGLIKAVPENGGFRYEYFKNNPADRESLSSNDILCAADDPAAPDRFLWIGTKGGGLNRMDKQTGQFRHFKTEQGLPDNVVYGILTDNDRQIWLSTNKGLCRLNVEDFSVRNFTAADGLQSNEFNQGSYLKMKDGRLVFGGVNGLTVFHPDSLGFNRFIPHTQIVGFTVNNEKIPIPGDMPIALTHRQNLIGIDFSALDFSNPAQNQYRYQLIRERFFGNGKIQDWTPLKNKNSVQFNDLQSGTYTFKVMGSNNDGTWSQEPAVIQFTIRPPWWRSWWAGLLYVTGAAVFIFRLYRYQLRQRLQTQETLRLRELDDFKNRFFTNITHEFRTPLTVILGVAEKLQQQDPRPDSPLHLISRNGENLLRLINQLLDLSKMESGAIRINYVWGDVLPYLRYIAESLHSLSNAQNLMVRIESQEPEVKMDYDPERLLQIVYNLLSNAIKFTPSGGKIILRVSRENDRHPPMLKLAVIDNGVGIPPEELPFIFDRFYQANNLEKATTGGTGIGLALTRELVTAMGGEILVDSKPGIGSTFTVTLPIQEHTGEPVGQGIESITNLQAAVTPKAQRPQINPRPPAPSAIGDFVVRRPQLQKNEGGKPPTAPQLLLIEDNPDVLEYLASCLREKYALTFAYNGRAGIEKALEIVPDLIISDVMMPEKDGFQVVETLKHDERTSHIPIILLTAKASMPDRLSGLRRGADAYLAKPFREEELLVWIEQLIARRRQLQAYFSGNREQKADEPDQADLIPENSFMQKMLTVLEANYADSEFSVEALARAMAMSRTQVHRKLIALTSRSTTEHINAFRLEKARLILLAGELNVSEAAFQTGFNDPKYFSRLFGEAYGFPPSELRARSIPDR
ncbi:MAG: response regulator [Lewinellaceae bacterium]|nr:response regulator [Lewinellaceae bacterium]